MDRLIWTAWRAFWVGLGASTVLIAQTLLAPAPTMAPADPTPPSLNEEPSPSMKRAEPVVSRNPFNGQRGKVLARVRNAT